MLALVNGGTFDSATGGTFQSDTDGAFHSDIPGTFESDMGGTFKVLQSQPIGKAKIQQIQRQKYYCQDPIGYKFIHKYCRLSKFIYLPIFDTCI